MTSRKNMGATTKKRILRIAGYVLLPLFCLTVLFACNAFNPMGVAFLFPFEVVNYSGEDLSITPIGARGPTGTRGTLPISRWGHAWSASNQRTDFALPAGQTVRLVYDCDDVQFTELVCRRADGSHFIVPTGLDPVAEQYRAPPTARFAIGLAALYDSATPFHLAAIGPPRPSGWTLELLALSGLLSPLCFWLAKRIPADTGQISSPQQQG